MAILALERIKPSDGIVIEVLEILDGGFDLLVKLAHQFIRLLRVETSDTNHANLKQSLNILAAHLTNQFLFPRIEGFVHKGNQFLFVRCLFVSFFLIYTVLNKDLLQRSEEVLLLQFGFSNLQLPLQQRFGMLY